MSLPNAPLLGRPAGLTCEARHATFNGACAQNATHIYGPECEAETGKLMYLCRDHTEQIGMWMLTHPNEPVECPDHGRIGPVKSYLILKAL